MSTLFKTNYVSTGHGGNWNLYSSISQDGQLTESNYAIARGFDSATVTGDGITIVLSNKYYLNTPVAVISSGEGKNWTEVDLSSLGLPGLNASQGIVFLSGAYANTGTSYSQSGKPNNTDLFVFLFSNPNLEKVYELYTKDGSQWWCGEIQSASAMFTNIPSGAGAHLSSPLLFLKGGGYYQQDAPIFAILGTNQIFTNSSGSVWGFSQSGSTLSSFGEDLIISSAIQISPNTVGLFTTNNKLIVIESKYESGQIRALPSGAQESTSLYYKIYDFSSEASASQVSDSTIVQGAGGYLKSNPNNWQIYGVAVNNSTIKHLSFFVPKNGKYIDFSASANISYSLIFDFENNYKLQHVVFDSLNEEFVFVTAQYVNDFRLQSSYLGMSPGYETNPRIVRYDGVSSAISININSSIGEILVVHTPIEIITTDGYSYGGGTVDYVESLIPTTIYTVPENKETVVTSIFVSNSDISEITYDLAIVPSGEELSLKHYIRWDMPVSANNFDLISSKITMSAGDSIVVHPSVAGKVSFTVMGVEKS